MASHHSWDKNLNSSAKHKKILSGLVSVCQLAYSLLPTPPPTALTLRLIVQTAWASQVSPGPEPLSLLLPCLCCPFSVVWVPGKFLFVLLGAAHVLLLPGRFSRFPLVGLNMQVRMCHSSCPWRGQFRRNWPSSYIISGRQWGLRPPLCLNFSTVPTPSHLCVSSRKHRAGHEIGINCLFRMIFIIKHFPVSAKPCSIHYSSHYAMISCSQLQLPSWSQCHSLYLIYTFFEWRRRSHPAEPWMESSASKWVLCYGT